MSKTAKKVAKKAAKAAKTVIIALDPSAKIVVNKSIEAPAFREGTAVAKRVSAVLASNGKPVEFAIKKGARPSTVRFLAKAKVIRLITAASTK